jgi:hypothetical protein
MSRFTATSKFVGEGRAVEGQTALQMGQMTDGNMSRVLVWNQQQSMYQELLLF